MTVTTTTLAGKIVGLSRAMVGASIPHAFGGALALAYYAEPRATIDIDLNVFTGVERWDEVAGVLDHLGVDTHGAARLVARDGQARVWWDATPLDLFFAYDSFHIAASKATRTVPFGGAEIAILSPEHLVVCKVVFDRPKDWVDIDSMLALNGPLDTAEILRWVGRIAGDTDRRYDRIAALLTR